MVALDFDCTKGPYCSRGQLLKGSTPQGQKVSGSKGQWVKRSVGQKVSRSVGQKVITLAPVINVHVLVFRREVAPL
jgi:hypothetical protein